MSTSGVDGGIASPDDGDWVSDIRDESDAPADVDATFRTLRRAAGWHFMLFLGVVVSVPMLTLTVGWWSDANLLGGMAPSFIMAAIGLYLFFFVLAVAATRQSNAVEDRMLGHPDRDEHNGLDGLDGLDGRGGLDGLDGEPR